MITNSLSSSNLYGSGYDADKKELYLQFHNGDIYTYSGVEEDVYDSLNRASSAGKYFHANIKGVYSFTKG